MFYYEHIGHMQFSTLTLRALEVLDTLAQGKVGAFVPCKDALDLILKSGFSARQAEGELDRFCYGFECLDKFDAHGKRELALTEIGRAFIDNLLRSQPYQSAEIACLLRPAHRLDHWNITVQESTFFNPTTYDAIQASKFRRGPARDYLRCLKTGEFYAFLGSALETLDIAPSNAGNPTLELCRTLVQSEGKYWASVGGEYSWFVFPQKFTTPFSSEDWSYYDNLVKILVRPPEWGGGQELSFKALSDLLGGQARLFAFREAGVVRPRWVSPTLESSQFRLTSPGYLMWERRTKGFIFELSVRRLGSDAFCLTLCDAADRPHGWFERVLSASRSGVIPSFSFMGEKREVMRCLEDLLQSETSLHLV